MSAISELCSYNSDLNQTVQIDEYKITRIEKEAKHSHITVLFRYKIEPLVDSYYSFYGNCEIAFRDYCCRTNSLVIGNQKIIRLEPILPEKYTKPRGHHYLTSEFQKREGIVHNDHVNAGHTTYKSDIKDIRMSYKQFIVMNKKTPIPCRKVKHCNHVTS